MEFHQLRDFVAVATVGNFSRAAINCHVAQPTLSKAIQRLERELGEKLFFRSTRKASLTEAGEALYPRATRILSELQEATREFAERRGTRGGTIYLGALPTISPYYLPKILPRFIKQNRSVAISIVENTMTYLLALLESCELDLAIVTLPVPKDRFDMESLLDEEWMLVVPAFHPLAKKETVRASDLKTERFIRVNENDSPILQAGLTESKQSKLNGQIILKASQACSIQALVFAGLGISLVPRMSISDQPLLAYRSFEKNKMRRTIAVIWRKGREHSLAVKHFLEYLIEVGRFHPVLPAIAASQAGALKQTSIV